MIRLLIRCAFFLGSAAVGILAAVWLLPEVSVSAAGFVTAVVLFAIAQSVLSPFITKIAAKNAPAFLGGIGLVSTFVALVIASAFGGLSISGWRTWVLATLVVWLVTALATLVLPLVFLRNRREEKKAEG
ncbi:phage holin family protein [Rhodococcus sp. AG1013]|uniref:phage holin family protein n=1 Tax=unclassified Rhodococcus (in: high G+C Gram-positive bacteria) TaxID=192944 RepID=UPI000E0AF033|nr:phage holin family protein [Rhodococcus sp. AG1013]RDI26960.1 superfamily IV 4 TMS phage holin [Rhodococcus sp. AG1013]